MTFKENGKKLKYCWYICTCNPPFRKGFLGGFHSTPYFSNFPNCYLRNAFVAYKEDLYLSCQSTGKYKLCINSVILPRCLIFLFSVISLVGKTATPPCGLFFFSFFLKTLHENYSTLLVPCKPLLNQVTLTCVVFHLRAYISYKMFYKQ